MTDLDYMARAVSLAQRGHGFVEPNPMVGALIVKDGSVVGSGWHERFGEAHAEINALRDAGEMARGGTLYVTLEPCCHFGKTPPCTESVIQAGVSRVVAAMLDPFPKVSGQGVSRLREAGIIVEVGVGEVLARELNAPYLMRLREKRTWVVAKWAMTLDGKISTSSQESKWITGEKSRERVHWIRGHMDAILVGKGTLLADDPLLTARPAGPRVPTRVVVTASAEKMPQTCKLLQTINEAPVLVATCEDSVERLRSWKDAGAEIVGFPRTKQGFDPSLLLVELASRGMTNVLVEGGSSTLGNLLSSRLIDEVYAFIAPKVVGGAHALSPIGGEGISALSESLSLADIGIEILGTDVLIHGRTQAISCSSGPSGL
jgi:diaminohydroxyphosphoribosylaminopyrimidine deaminase/5-amino-6-(5-phosphoribosylamino)uracil reductase